MRPPRTVLPLLLVVLLSGCVSPSRTDRDYELKAGSSAKAVASSVASALLGAEAAAKGKAPGPYLSVLLGRAEKDVASVQAQFDGVQPPSERADRVRAQLDEQLQAAVDGLADLRIAVRRGATRELLDLAAPLRPVLDALRTMAEDWQ